MILAAEEASIFTSVHKFGEDSARAGAVCIEGIADDGDAHVGDG
jgi:hypothetical protein